MANGSFDLRFPGPAMDKVEYEDGALVLGWVVNETKFAIVLMDNGKEEMASVLGTVTVYLVSALFADILVQNFRDLTNGRTSLYASICRHVWGRTTTLYASICRHVWGRTFPATRSTVLATLKILAITQWPRNPSTFSTPSTN